MVQTQQTNYSTHEHDATNCGDSLTSLPNNIIYPFAHISDLVVNRS
jgi:hypothetical protein